MSYATAHAPWILHHSVEIDRYCPSFCGGIFRMREARLHVVAAYLSSKPPSETEAADVGQFLLRANHQSILAAAYDVVPQGFRRALRRAGPTVHEERFYAILFDLLNEPTDKTISRCIAHLGALDLQTLLILQMLPRQICRPNVVRAVSDPEEAAHVSTAFNLLLRNGVEKALLVATLGSAEPATGLTGAFRTAVRHARAPAHPVPSSEDYTPLSTCDELNQAARKFRNCMRSYTTRFLDPDAGHAFAIATRKDENTVVHLARLPSGRWKLEGLFGPSNRRPSPRARHWIVRYLKEHGVVIGSAPKRQATEWDSLRRVMEEAMLGFDFEVDFDDAPDDI